MRIFEGVNMPYPMLDETPAMALDLTDEVWLALKFFFIRLMSATSSVGTGPSSVTACWNQPLIVINVIKLYQYHEVVPNIAPC
jgi:hypothetical protein